MEAVLEPRVIRPLEHSGLVTWPEWFPRLPIRGAKGLYLHHVLGALVTVAPRVDASVFNRVLGIGHFMPAFPSLVDRIHAIYKRARVPSYSVQVSPYAEPDGIGEWLRRRGFLPAAPWARMTRGAEPIRDADVEGVEIVDLEKSGLLFSVFGRAIQLAFGYPPLTLSWFDLFVGRKGWHHYVAIDRRAREIVGGAAFFRTGRLASLEIAGVVPHARRRGIHTALIARQIRDAADLGCTRVTMETAVDECEWRGQAYRNARRLGFELAYFTANWEWRRARSLDRHAPGRHPFGEEPPRCIPAISAEEFQRLVRGE